MYGGCGLQHLQPPALKQHLPTRASDVSSRRPGATFRTCKNTSWGGSWKQAACSEAVWAKRKETPG